MFTLKKWLWTQWQTWRGVDRAYAQYLAHFAQVAAARSDQSMAADLPLEPMSREAFQQVWQQKGLGRAGKSCGCHGGGCH